MLDIFISYTGRLLAVFVDRFRNFGLLGSIRLLISLISTRFVIRNARIIRYPIYLRGRAGMVFGKGLTTGRFNRLEVFDHHGSSGLIRSQPRLFIGKNVQINDFNHIAAIEHVSIGDNTLIASRVFISDHNHGCFDGSAFEDGPDTPPEHRPLHAKPVHIGMNVWIGESVCVLPGVTVGDGAVIGAGAVVTRDVPPRCAVAGSPARVIRGCDYAIHEWQWA
ncbi:acetyltransferase [Chlorobium phaeovibrioides]|uniref:DapH/DapD/GlmU-related protein n=1 Tax=Chlorobium phaeovibrioides TaxID=1094 RepID=UPI000F842FAD|nr:DapH/DapD/GlmU-related protein [Chlorobium phaeovibrioides]RTY33712.1 acetyltransferase [Chlorobium phaeovibrioides]